MLCHFRSLTKFPPITRQPYPLTIRILKPKHRLSPDSNFKSPLAHTWDVFCLPSPAGHYCAPSAEMKTSPH